MTYKGKTITKHIRGNWFVRVRQNGKVVSIYGRTQFDCYEKLKAFIEKTEIDRAAKWLQRLESITPQPAQTATAGKSAKAYTFKEWYDEWLNSYKVGTVRAQTIYAFQSQIKRLTRLWDCRLSEITNIMLVKAVNEVTANRAKDGVHNLLKQMFAVAFNNRIIEVNPASSLQRPKQFAKFEKKALSAEQEKQVIDLCLTDLERHEPLLVCLLQGLRKGEMLALKPNDFNFDKDTLRIDESYSEVFPDDMQTKNLTSNRTMPMFSLTKQVLTKYADANPNERIYKDFTEYRLLKGLTGILKKLNLPRMTVHELRHTFISRCHEKKIDEIVVQKWVGHAIGSVMTKAVYTHVGSETEQRFIEILNQKTA